MLKLSYRIILGGILSMVLAAIMLYFDTLTTLSYVLLVIGFLGVGIGILLGFFKMVSEDAN